MHPLPQTFRRHQPHVDDKLLCEEAFALDATNDGVLNAAVLQANHVQRIRIDALKRSKSDLPEEMENILALYSSAHLMLRKAYLLLETVSCQR